MRNITTILGLAALAGCVQDLAPEGAALAPDAWEAPSGEWSVYRGSYANNAYSRLEQINRDNVERLQVAWVHHTGDAAEGVGSKIETNPLLANGMLYVVSPRSKLVALHPATGEEIWSFQPGQSGTVRGLSYWEDGDDRRLFFPVQQYVYAVDADDGSLVEGFGEGGRIDTRYGLGRDPDSLSVRHTSPGAVFEDLIIFGGATGESYVEAPGHIRAYDVRTGEMRWIFRTIPEPGEFGYDTWPRDAHREVGGANAWSGVSLDPRRALVFVATGSPGFDFYGGYRHGQNLFGNSVIALDARTGERKWHYQTVHHDVWDYDLPVPPTLVTVMKDGQPVDAVAQLTKTGFVFVLDRDTGEPLFPVEERPVPASDVPGEALWPTQPFPTLPEPFVHQDIREEDLTTVSAEANARAKDLLGRVRVGPIFTPPSLQGTLFRPGTRGGSEWNGNAFDPETGVLYVNAHELPSIVQLLPPAEVGEGAGLTEVGRAVFEANGCTGCHGADRAGIGVVPALRDLEGRLTREEVEAVIRNGRGAMPAHNRLSASGMEALLAYLFSDEAAAPAPRAGARADAQGRMRYTHNGYTKFLDDQGRPAVRPPWGTLTAIDLGSGERLWQIPLGEWPGAPRELQPTGTLTYGGGVVTRGGLIFIGTTMDEKFRALDKATGEVLWEYQLPAGGYATPAVYEYEGKQYVVIAAGGGGDSLTPSGDAYVAFALP